MAGSQRPKRRRAAGPALPVAPRTPRPRSDRKRSEQGAEGGRNWPAITLIVVALIAAATGTFFWSAPVWGALAPHWPGGGYGFAVTVGLLLPLVLGVMGVSWLRMRRSAAAGAPAGPAGAFGWGAGVFASGAAAVFLLALELGAIRPKRRNRDSGCYQEGGACWISDQYPLAWLAGVLAIPVGILLVVWCAGRFGKQKSASWAGSGGARRGALRTGR